MKRRWPVAILALCMFGWTLWAQEAIQPSCLSNENFRHYRVARTPRLSPDGRRVVYVIQEGAADRGVSHLWWTDVARPDGACQITFSPSKDKSGESDPQ